MSYKSYLFRYLGIGLRLRKGQALLFSDLGPSQSHITLSLTPSTSVHQENSSEHVGKTCKKSCKFTVFNGFSDSGLLFSMSVDGRMGWTKMITATRFAAIDGRTPSSRATTMQP